MDDTTLSHISGELIPHEPQLEHAHLPRFLPPNPAIDLVHSKCLEVLPQVEQFLLERNEQRYTSTDLFKPWRDYNTTREDVFRWPNCAAASIKLAEMLHLANVPVSIQISYQMPLGSVPYSYRRGDDPFIPVHVLLHYDLPEEGGKIIIDPTYQQFLSWLNRNDVSELRQSLPQTLLITPDFLVPSLATHLAGVARTLSKDYWTTCWNDEDEMSRDFSNFWDPKNYKPTSKEILMDRGFYV